MDEQAIIQQIDHFIDERMPELEADIGRLVATNSVEGAPAPGAPYGKEARHALDEALAMAGAWGLATHEGEGHVGWAELPGREAGHLATITHLDIVPAGEGWTGDPFTLRKHEGWLLGRGVQDDKGPAVLSLYAARFFHESGLPLRYGLRVLLGSNEETGMLDVDHYLAHQPQPLFCFSPDAVFPVCNGEKGVFEGDFTSGPLGEGEILDFVCEGASNVIPQRASCTLRTAKPLPPREGIEAEALADGSLVLTAHGIGGHAAHPEGTRNAIGMLVDLLWQAGVGNEAERQALGLLHALHSNSNGSGLGIACDDGLFDPLTCIGGTIKLEEGRLVQNINIRYPTCTTGGALSAALGAEAAKYGAGYATASDAPPFYIPADSPAIDTLMATWNEISGRSDKPFTMGGGTYARHFKNAVSFGPGLPDEDRPAFAGKEHMADEAISLAALRQALKISILALWRLQSVDF